MYSTESIHQNSLPSFAGFWRIWDIARMAALLNVGLEVPLLHKSEEYNIDLLHSDWFDGFKIMNMRG